MIDCHAHLAAQEFDADLPDVIERAKNAGVKGVIVVAQFSNEYQKILDIFAKYPNFCFPALGLHPVQRDRTSVQESDFSPSVEQQIRDAKDKICALGECGLDFSPRYLKNGDEDKKQQREVFRKHIELANELNVPVNVHSRSAGRPVIEWLLKYKANSALLHCYAGNVKSARPAIQAGYYFSIPPSFSTDPEREALVKEIPIEQMCLETDSPYLNPNKEERNEPANVLISANFIAKIKGIPVEDVKRITTENACRLFKLSNLLE